MLSPRNQLRIRFAHTPDQASELFAPTALSVLAFGAQNGWWDVDQFWTLPTGLSGETSADVAALAYLTLAERKFRSPTSVIMLST